MVYKLSPAVIRRYRLKYETVMYVGSLDSIPISAKFCAEQIFCVEENKFYKDRCLGQSQLVADSVLHVSRDWFFDSGLARKFIA